MKAIKLKSSPNSNPIWGAVVADRNYTRVVNSPVPVIYDVRSIASIAKNIIIESDRRQFLAEYEMVNVDIVIRK